MPPAGIDRFNFVAGPGLSIPSVDLVQAWDHSGAPVPMNLPTPFAVPDGDVVAHAAPLTGQPPPDDLYKIGRVRIELTGGVPGAVQHWTFDMTLLAGNASYWIGQVVVGLYETPRGPDPYEPFCLLELVNANGTHRFLPMQRGPHITSP